MLYILVAEYFGIYLFLRTKSSITNTHFRCVQSAQQGAQRETNLW